MSKYKSSSWEGERERRAALADYDADQQMDMRRDDAMTDPAPYDIARRHAERAVSETWIADDPDTRKSLADIIRAAIDEATDPLLDELDELRGCDVRLRKALAERNRLREAIKSVTNAPCPHDTNRDGDCGRPLCPYCGPQGVLRAALAKGGGDGE